MTKQRLFLLAGTALCLAAAGWLARWSEAPETDIEKSVAGRPTQERAVVFPRDRPKKKSVRRPAPTSLRPTTQQATHTPEVSAIERAVYATGNDEAVFVEFSAIRNSSFVEKLIDCQSHALAAEWEESVEQLGYDWRKDIDRLAISPHAVAMSGFFENAKVPEAFGVGESYGDGARIYRPDPASPVRYVVANENLVAMAKNESDAKTLIDRVEGRVPVTPTSYPQVAEHEVYGQISASMLASLLDQDQPLANDLTDLIENISVRMEVDDYLSLSLDVQSKDAEKAADLAKSVGGLLALARREAELAGDAELASLLEAAQVLPGDAGKFGVDLAVPESWMLERMGCDETDSVRDVGPKAGVGDDEG